MLKTREDVDQAIAELRAMIGSYEADEKWASWRSPLREMTGLLDYLEKQVQAVGWPLATPGAFDKVDICLYAIRNLDELDEGQLTTRICNLYHHLNHPGLPDDDGGG